MKYYEVWETNNYVHASRPPSELVNEKIEATSGKQAIEKHIGEAVRRSGMLNRGRIVWATESGRVYIANELSAQRLTDLEDYERYRQLLAECYQPQP